MQQVAVLQPDTLIVLLFLVDSNIFELLLEIQGISHLVKQKRQKEIIPTFIEPFPPLLLSRPHRFVKHEALRRDITARTGHCSSKIQQRVEPVFFGVLSHECAVVFVVGTVIQREDDCVEARVRVLVPVVEFEAHEKCVHIQVTVCGGEGFF